MTKDALLEIGTEEIPASYIEPAMEQLGETIKKSLELHQLPYQEIRSYATPRRLCVVIKKLNEKTQDRLEEYSGPMLTIAKDQNGAYTQAARGFASKYNVSVEKLIIKKKEKGEYVCIEKKIPGRKAEDLLKEVFPDAIKKLSFPKSMVWEESGFRFARPIRTVIALFANKVIKFSVAGVKSNNYTFGLHTISRKKITISTPERYETELRNNCVLMDQKKRRAELERVMENATKHMKGDVVVDQDLLREVNYLVEHPVAIVGTFDEKYLKLPQEVLINCMRKKQKFFPVINKKELTNHFIGIRNGISENQNVVKEGYERVLSARLSDAEFFFHQDTKRPLAEKAEKLKGVVFHDKLLGDRTMFGKINRVKKIASFLNDRLNDNVKVDGSRIERACMLLKADLVTEMVFEFPEMQGVIGRIYAEHDNEDKDVSQAVEEHYWPLVNDGKLPKTGLGTILALSDKLDTLTGYFSVGIQPSGSADPYGLRRLAAGILRILIEKQFPVRIKELIDILKSSGWQISQEVEKSIKDFLKLRIENIFETKGYKFDEVRSVLATEDDDLLDIQNRLEALKKIRKLPDFEPLATAFKRTANILKQAKKNNFEIPGTVDENLFKEEAEKKLFLSIYNLENNLKVSLDNKDYMAVLKQMVTIKPDVDEFFVKVMVMAEDISLRANRLAVLKYIENLFFKVLDFSQLQ
ncbi:MAG: glycine--tRNA ligase subunit beta [Elusimicrobia bacterium]|nr:glycine--tRNA ligase subunit beta [Candidatus Liberimonas magnetica]